MDKVLKVSEARRRLFDLVDEVTGEGEEEVVLIEHRDRAKRAALMSEEYLRHLRATIAALRKERAGGFRLAGSMTLAVGEDELEAEIARSRAEQASLAERKAREL